jgi:hypothetical protein
MQVTETAIEIVSRETLEAAIEQLEAQQKEDLRAIKADLDDAYESLKPVHVVKTLVSEIFHSPEVKKSVFQSALGYGAGLLAKKFVAGNSRNPFKRMLGYFTQLGVTNMVTANSEDIRKEGTNLLERLIKRYGPEGRRRHREELEQREQRAAEENEKGFGVA